MLTFFGGPRLYIKPPRRAQGEYAEAEPLLERSQTIREKALGPEHPDVAQSFNNRATLLESQVGSIRIFLEVSQGRHCSIISSWWTADNTPLLAAQGKYSEADLLYLRAIEIGEKALGPDHPDLATWLSNRALVLLKAKLTAGVGILDDQNVRPFSC